MAYVISHQCLKLFCVFSGHILAMSKRKNAMWKSVEEVGVMVESNENAGFDQVDQCWGFMLKRK